MGDIYTNPPQSRNEAILRATIDGVEYTAPPQSRIEDLLLELKAAIEGGGGGGTTVVPNPEGEPTADLDKVQIGSNVYGVLGELGTAAKKNSTNAVTEDSTALVESGAVKTAIDASATATQNLMNDTVGWISEKELLTNPESAEKYGVTFTVYSDSRAKANGLSTSDNAYIQFPFFPTKSGQRIMRGLNSGNTKIQLYMWCTTDNARPYTDSSKSTRQTTSDYVYNGNETSFYVEANKEYRVVFRVGSGANADNVMAYPEVLSHVSVDSCKTDNSVIAPVENGTTASQAYAVGAHFIRNGAFCTVIQSIASGATLTENTNYTSGDVADLFNRNTGTIIPHNIDNVSITLVGSDIKKIGNVVCFSVRFTLSDAVALDAKFLELGYPSIMSETVKFPFFNTATGRAYSGLLYLNSDGTLQGYTTDTIPAGTYTVSGTYLTE